YVNKSNQCFLQVPLAQWVVPGRRTLRNSSPLPSRKRGYSSNYNNKIRSVFLLSVQYSRWKHVFKVLAGTFLKVASRVYSYIGTRRRGIYCPFLDSFFYEGNRKVGDE
ncbi:hypothetical protein L9F63_018350, partial [Diploptera punctata]